MTVCAHVKLQNSTLCGCMIKSNDVVFSAANNISADWSPITIEAITKILYFRNATVFYDRIDGDCQMRWMQAQKEQTPQYQKAEAKTLEILESRHPQAELIKVLGKAALSGEMADFTWMFGTDWFVETRFGNFHWLDPDHGNGDNSFTLFEGSYADFLTKTSTSYGRDKGRKLILNKCGENFDLKIPQLDG